MRRRRRRRREKDTSRDSVIFMLFYSLHSLGKSGPSLSGQPGALEARGIFILPSAALTGAWAGWLWSDHLVHWLANAVLLLCGCFFL